MKKIILIILIITVAKNVSAQLNGVPDTLAYLQTIVANKAQYIGQPFSTLIDNLQIQIKHFIPFASISYDKTKETSTSFFILCQSSRRLLFTISIIGNLLATAIERNSIRCYLDK